MEKRVALLKDGIVFNIVVAYSAEEMTTLFNCEAIEVTDETEQAHIGYGFANGFFEQPPYVPPVVEETVAQDDTPVLEENL
jgi:hypothetical protein